MLRLDDEFAFLPISNRQSAISNQRCVYVVATEMGIAARREHLEDAVIQLQNRDIESAAAEVVDSDLRFLLQLVEAVGERRRRRFVDDALDRKTRGLAGRLRGVTLGIVEID